MKYVAILVLLFTAAVQAKSKTKRINFKKLSRNTDIRPYEYMPNVANAKNGIQISKFCRTEGGTTIKSRQKSFDDCADHMAAGHDLRDQGVMIEIQ